MDFGNARRKGVPEFPQQFHGFNSAFPRPNWCYVPGVRPIHDLARSLTFGYNQISFDYTRKGMANYGANTSIYRMVTDEPAITSDAFTIAFSWGDLGAIWNTSTSRILFSIDGTTPGSKLIRLAMYQSKDGTQNLDLDENLSDNPTFALELYDGTNNVGGETTEHDGVGVGAFEYHTLVVTHNGIAGAVKFWRDGIFMPGNDYQSGNSVIESGTSESGFSLFGGKILHATTWNQCLPDAMAVAISARPQVIFAPPRSRTYFFPSGAITVGRARSYTLLIG